jgi:hypothetical protein
MFQKALWVILMHTEFESHWTGDTKQETFRIKVFLGRHSLQMRGEKKDMKDTSAKTKQNHCNLQFFCKPKTALKKLSL